MTDREDGDHHADAKGGARAPDHAIEDVVLPLGGAKEVLIAGRLGLVAEPIARDHVRIARVLGWRRNQGRKNGDRGQNRIPAAKRIPAQRRRILEQSSLRTFIEHSNHLSGLLVLSMHELDLLQAGSAGRRRRTARPRPGCRTPG